MWAKTQDESVVDASGRVIFFSTKRFVSDIGLGQCCFICGAKPEDKAFNNEHIVPDWLLSRFNLFDKHITLPNGVRVRYDRYKVPCCVDCNSQMGRDIEQQVSKIVEGGARSIYDFVSSGGDLQLFVWMGLIFLKTHLKDRSHYAHLDRRRGEQRIADDYEWEDLHHVHSVVRSFYTGCTPEPEAVGSFLLLPVAPGSPGNFDFLGLYSAQTMLLRLNDVAMLTVFNDSKIAEYHLCQRLFATLQRPLSPLQLREIAVELAFVNSHVKYRPRFATECNLPHQTCCIVGMPYSSELSEMDLRLRGRFFERGMDGMLAKDFTLPGKNRRETLRALRAGKVSFLIHKT